MVGRVGREPANPAVESKSVARLANAVNTSTGVALRSVIELDEEEVKLGVLDSIAKMSIRNNALRCCGNVVGFGAGRVQDVLQVADEGLVVSILVVLLRLGVHPALDIQIESIDFGISEWTRLVGGRPGGGLWAECSPKEFSEVPGDGWAGEVVISRPSSTERQQNLLSICLTLLDTRTNRWAAAQKLTVSSTVRLRVVGTTASIC